MAFFGSTTVEPDHDSDDDDDNDTTTSNEEAGDTTTFYEETDDDDDDDTFTHASTDSMSCDASLVPRQRRLRQERTERQQEQQRRVVDLAATSSEDITYYTSSFGEVDEVPQAPISPLQPTVEEDLSREQHEQSPVAIVNKSSSHASRKSEALQTTSMPESSIAPSRASTTRTMNRIPGGAAAKIMLIGPRGSLSDSTNGLLQKSSSESTHRTNQQDVLTGLEHDLIRAREEFVTGAPHTEDRMLDTSSLATNHSTPSFLNRNEVFHRTASAAVAALLSPDPSAPKEQGVFASFPSSPAHYEAKPVVSPNLIDKNTEQKVEDLESKMLDPTATLTGLLKAIATPEEDLADELGYAVRRKNACGAIQTLSANPSNRTRVCWTVGVLPALTSVLQDGLRVTDDNARIRAEYQAAQTRAISALMNLSMPVKNRIAVFHSPGLVRAALSTVDEQAGQPRQGCTAILAFLAKSPENRLLLAQVPGILDVVCKVLKPRPPRTESSKPKREKKVYPWSDDNSTSSSTISGGEDSAPPSLAMSYDDSGTTPKQGEGVPLELTGYDETADTLLRGARQNCFAMLGHLVKEKDNAYHFARDLNFLATLVDISHYQQSPSHTLAVKILAHLTRHRLNKVLAFKPKIVVPALVEATQSHDDDARLFACHALQNLSQEKSCRQELAISDHLIEALCERCRVSTSVEERLATISTLKNLCDEPANLIPMTNTADCVSTLMQMADTSDDAMIQYRACDALATLSHWLRKIATSGYSLDAAEQGRPPMKGLFVPTLREVSWNQWT